MMKKDFQEEGVNLKKNKLEKERLIATDRNYEAQKRRKGR